MIILAIDPGPTTGIAVLRDDDVVWTDALPAGEVKFLLVGLGVTLLTQFEHVVAEAPPEWGGNNRTTTQIVEEAVKDIFPGTEWVQPGQWKPTPPGRSQVAHRSQHVKDAVRIARWFRWNKERKSSGITT